MAAQKKRRSSGTGSIFKDKYGYFNAQVDAGYTPAGKGMRQISWANF
jgi:hypothetical protein